MKINDILNETGVGGIAGVAMPMGKMNRRIPGMGKKKKKTKESGSEVFDAGNKVSHTDWGFGISKNGKGISSIEDNKKKKKKKKGDTQ